MGERIQNLRVSTIIGAGIGLIVAGSSYVIGEVAANMYLAEQDNMLRCANSIRDVGGSLNAVDVTVLSADCASMQDADTAFKKTESNGVVTYHLPESGEFVSSMFIHYKEKHANMYRANEIAALAGAFSFLAMAGLTYFISTTPKIDSYMNKLTQEFNSSAN